MRGKSLWLAGNVLRGRVWKREQRMKNREWTAVMDAVWERVQTRAR